MRDAVPACTLRIAEPKDIDALAQLHVAIWRDTYRELAPAGLCGA